MNQRKKLLDLAETLVNGDRNRQYGDPNSDFFKTAQLWETYLNGVAERQNVEVTEVLGDLASPLPILIEPHDVAVLMILLKVSRLTWTPDKEDTWADIAGYAACGWDCVAEDEELEHDEEFQTDIAVDLDEDGQEEAYYEMLMSILNAPTAESQGGYITGSLFGKKK